LIIDLLIIDLLIVDTAPVAHSRISLTIE